MKITLLDALEGGELGAALRQALTSETLLADHRLREERFAPCQGCFECWVKHPGTCKAKDAATAEGKIESNGEHKSGSSKPIEAEGSIIFDRNELLKRIANSDK